MAKYKISLIIPVYNTEKYLRQCIRSIDINNKNWQIIFVNDGSTDNSLEILNEYKEYENIIILNQKNKGLSEARNRGIISAEGKYICFLDSDDMLGQDFQNKIDKNVDLSRDDKVYFYNFISFYGNEIIDNDYDFSKYKNRILKAKYIRKIFIKKNIACIACRYLIPKKEFLNIKFFSNIYHEDELFTTHLLSNDNNKFEYIEVKYLYRRERNDSITNTLNQKHFDSVITILKNLKTKKNNKFIKFQKGKLLIRLLYVYINLSKITYNIEELYKVIDENKRYIKINNLKNILIKISLYLFGKKTTLMILKKYGKSKNNL